MTFDLTTVYNADRPLSWSGISSFQWNKKQWYDKYVRKILPEITPELEFGSMVDKKFQDNKKFLPKLVRYPVMQHEMRVEWDGIPLLGYSDQYDPSIPAIRDLKTGRKPWDAKRARDTGQLTMYLFMLWLMDKSIKPEKFELYIDWAPTHIEDGKVAFVKEGDIRTFKTSRTMRDILLFGSLIKETWAEMEEYCARQQSVVPHIKVAKPVSSMLK